MSRSRATRIAALILAVAVAAIAFACMAFAFTLLVRNESSAMPLGLGAMLILFFISGNFFNVNNHTMRTIANVFPVKHLNTAIVTVFNPHTAGSGIKGWRPRRDRDLGARVAADRDPLLPLDTRIRLTRMRRYTTNRSASTNGRAERNALVDRSVVLVTGAGRGIGQSTAKLLAEHRYTVFGTAREPSGESMEGFELVALDVTSQESVDSCVSAVLERAGRIDVLLNNAGVGLIGAEEEASIEEARVLFDTNLFGVARMINAVLPGMRARRSGLIINFGSLGATLPVPFHGYLSASKAAVSTYSDALRLELKSLGVDVSVVEPGFTATHPGERFAQMRVARSINDYTEQQKRATAVMEQGQRAGIDPRTVAETVLGIIRSKDPAPYYPVGREKWLLRLTRILPPSAIESLMSRRFELSK